jgi:hypothetical protein
VSQRRPRRPETARAAPTAPALYANADLIDVNDVNDGATGLVLKNTEVRRATNDCIDMAGPAGVLIERTPTNPGGWAMRPGTLSRIRIVPRRQAHRCRRHLRRIRRQNTFT